MNTLQQRQEQKPTELPLIRSLEIKLRKTNHETDN